MVDKACTFGLEQGPCYTMPSVAIWTDKSSKRKTWTCDKHDTQIDERLRKAQLRSGYKRQALAR